MTSGDLEDSLIGIVFLLLLSGLLIFGLAFLQAKATAWVIENCEKTEQVRTVQDNPTYVNVGGPDSAIMVPIGGGAHQERAYLCPDKNRPTWLPE